MADIVDTATRSRMMSSIRGKNTGPELLVRHGLHRLGVRFRLHCKELPGRPDLVFPKFHAVLFVHGCFWHRHTSCRLAYTPSSNSGKWLAKFEATVERDRKQIAQLKQSGWRVLVVWECAIRRDYSGELLAGIVEELKSGSAEYCEWPALLHEKSSR